MALDFTKSPYTSIRKRGNSKSRTSYGQMTQWLAHAAEPIEHPYSTALDHGVFRRMEPVLDVPLSARERYSGRGDSREQQERAYTERARREGKIVIPEDPGPGGPSAQYYKSGGYDDFHKTFLQQGKQDITPTYPLYGPPRLRNGRVGGSWRHVTEVLQAKGKRIIYVDGVPRGQDNSRITHGENPGIDVIQSRYGTELPITVKAKPEKIWTRHDLEAFRAAESGNWHIMR